MRLAFVAGRESSYPRNRIILRLLRDLGHHVIEGPQCPPPFGGRKAHSFLKQLEGQIDAVFLGFFAQHLVHAARLAVKTKPILMDAFVSAHDTLVSDRRTISARSPLARLLKRAEISAVQSCDYLLTDTYAHKNFLVKLTKFPADKVHVLHVGTDPELFRPSTSSSSGGPLRVHFHGDAQRLHGLDVVMEALRDFDRSELTMRLVARGKPFERWRNRQCARLPAVVDVHDPVPYAELPRLLHNADVCLGIFGKSDKAQRVIPNKIYEAAACAKASITISSPAMAEVFRPNVSYFAVDGSASDLTQMLQTLRHDRMRIAQVSQAARADYEAHASIKMQRAVVEKMIDRVTPRVAT